MAGRALLRRVLRRFLRVQILEEEREVGEAGQGEFGGGLE